MTRMEALLIVLVVAACTLITRLIPFVLFGGKRQVPEKVHYLGRILPPAIMATLVVYCLKGADVFSPDHGLPEFLSVLLTALLHIWKRNVLLSIAAGTVFYMVLVQMIFAI